MDCLFCKIINKEISSHKVWESENFYAFLDIAPKNEGHTLLVPKKCVKDILSSDPEISKHAHAATKKINLLFEVKLGSEGLTILTNNKLGQEVTHLHWHLIPRFTKENYSLPETMDLDLEKTLKKLA